MPYLSPARRAGEAFARWRGPGRRRAPVAADEGEDFVADGGHGVVAGCFDVEAEQGPVRESG